MIYTKKFFAKSTATGVVFGFLACLGIWVFHFVDGPVAAGAAMVDPNKANAPLEVKPRFLQGLNVQMNYPGQFDLISHLNTDKEALEQYNIGQSTKTQLTMAISVHPLESGLLNDDSSWRVRALNKAKYQTNNETLQNETVSFMTKIDNTEKTLFWVHKGKLLIIALSTNDTNDDLPTMMASIKSTIKWRL